eukprot:2762619-Alexandrium_andersonii.AAC.1
MAHVSLDGALLRGGELGQDPHRACWSEPSEAVNRVVSRVCAERELQGLGPPLLLDDLLVALQGHTSCPELPM